MPNLSGIGGMVSFREKLAEGLARRGIETCADLDDPSYEAVLVIGGTRNIGKLWRARRRGIPVVQRLDGMNWIHREQRTGLRHYLRAEYGNTLLSFIRTNLATKVIYQSEFSQNWWERVSGETRTPTQVIYNGVDLSRFAPDGAGRRSDRHTRILLVEGSLGGGYERGLENAAGMLIHLSEGVAVAHSHAVEKASYTAGEMMGILPLEVVVVGYVPHETQEYWERYIQRVVADAPARITWTGAVAHTRIPEIDRSAHLLFSADLNAACPNAVIEALACGTPVVAFGTGALPEIIQGDSGRVVPYGGNPWKLERPDVNALSNAALEILLDQPRFRAGARRRAIEAFGLEDMVDRYLAFMLD